MASWVLNLAAFYAKYHNFQANNPDLVAGVVVTRFTNAGEVSTRGVELDTIYRPFRDFSLSGGVAYTDAHVDQFNAPTPTAAVIPSGTPLGFAPKWKGNLSADYRWRTGGAFDFTFGAQGSYQSKQLSLFAADAVQRRLGTIKGYGLVNLSAGVTSTDDHYRLTFQVRNLFDQSFAASIINGGAGWRLSLPDPARCRSLLRHHGPRQLLIRVRSRRPRKVGGSFFTAQYSRRIRNSVPLALHLLHHTRGHGVMVEIGHDPDRSDQHQCHDQHAERECQHVVGIVGARS